MNFLLITFAFLTQSCSAHEADAQHYLYQSDSITMHVAATGDASKTAVLLLHGSPGSWQTWNGVLADQVLQKNYQLLAIDRPGYGKSGTEGTAEGSLKKQAEEAMGALQFNHSGTPAIIVGYSYSGALATRIALDHPETIARLILIAGCLSADLEQPKWWDYPAEWGFIRWLIPSFLVVSVDESMQLPSELRAIQSRFAEIHAPVSYLQGTEDQVVSTKTADFAQQNFTNASSLEIKRLPGLDHSIPMTNPEVVVNEITRKP